MYKNWERPDSMATETGLELNAYTQNPEYVAFFNLPYNINIYLRISFLACIFISIFWKEGVSSFYQILVKW